MSFWKDASTERLPLVLKRFAKTAARMLNERCTYWQVYAKYMTLVKAERKEAIASSKLSTLELSFKLKAGKQNLLSRLSIWLQSWSRPNGWAFGLKRIVSLFGWPAVLAQFGLSIGSIVSSRYLTLDGVDRLKIVFDFAWSVLLGKQL